MRPFPLPLSAVMDLLSWRHEIRDDKRTALRGRLQHFQSKGFPAGSNTGRGKAAAYGWDELILLGIAMDLLEIGMPPDLAVSIVRDETDHIFSGLSDNIAFANEPDLVPVRAFYLVVEGYGLHLLREPDNGKRGVLTMHQEDLEEAIQGGIQASLNFPILIVDVRRIVIDIMNWLTSDYGMGPEVYRSFINHCSIGDELRSQLGAGDRNNGDS